LNVKELKEVQLKPKSMISIGENKRPIMDYLLNNASRAGYTKVVIVINERDIFTPKYYARIIQLDSLFTSPSN